MCIIIDINMCDDFFNNKDYMTVVRKWMSKEGKLAYSATEKFEKELNSVNKMRKYFDSRRKSGRVKMVDSVKVQKEANKLEGKIKSNDEHILALAIVGKVKILVTDDVDLIEDFKNIKIHKGGKIYSDSMSTKQQNTFFNNHRCP